MNLETPTSCAARRQVTRLEVPFSQDAMLTRVAELPLELQHQIFDCFDVNDLTRLPVSVVLTRHPQLATPLSYACRQHVVETLGAVPPQPVQSPIDWIFLLEELAPWCHKAPRESDEPQASHLLVDSIDNTQPGATASYSDLLSVVVNERRAISLQMPWRRSRPSYFLTALQSELRALASSRLPEDMIVSANRLHALGIRSIEAQVDQWLALSLQGRQAEAAVHGGRVLSGAHATPAAFWKWTVKPLLELEARCRHEEVSDDTMRKTDAT